MKKNKQERVLYMCTAATYQNGDFYMGRTLDYERSYGDRVTITPRNFLLKFHCLPEMPSHYAMVGMAAVMDNYPLYYEAFNEKGLGICGLNFVGNTRYYEPAEGKNNLAQYELIPYLLGSCDSVAQVRRVLEKGNLVNIPFRQDLPLAQLHWLIADENSAITLESTQRGLEIFDNPVGVLTNNPPFPYQMFALNNYRALSPDTPENHFGTPLQDYSRGMGGLGLPGDLSSQSRFVRVAYTKLNSRSGKTESENVSQFFHILESVAQTRGLCRLPGGEYEITLYTSCCNLKQGIYYYTTYENNQISAVSMHHENLEGRELITYTPVTGQQIFAQN